MRKGLFFSTTDVGPISPKNWKGKVWREAAWVDKSGWVCPAVSCHTATKRRFTLFLRSGSKVNFLNQLKRPTFAFPPLLEGRVNRGARNCSADLHNLRATLRKSRRQKSA